MTQSIPHRLSAEMAQAGVHEWAESCGCPTTKIIAWLPAHFTQASKQLTPLFAHQQHRQIQSSKPEGQSCQTAEEERKVQDPSCKTG